MADPDVRVALLSGPLLPGVAAQSFLEAQSLGAGACLVFEGVVRPLESERPVAALLYEAYEPMTSRELHRLATQVLTNHGLLGIRVEHSVGRVGAGEISFRLGVAARHRKEALRAVDEFIDLLKQVVPLWKIPEWAP